MRVLHIGLSCMRGGIENCALNYFHELVSKNIIFDFVDIYGDGIAGYEEICALGGKVFSVGNFRKNPYRVYKCIQKIIQDGDYQKVHIHMLSAANLIPVLATLKTGIRPIVHCHSTDAFSSFLRGVLDGLGKNVLRQLPVTRLACGQSAGRWMWKNSDFTIIPNAIDTERYVFCEDDRNTIRSKMEIPHDSYVIGYVGRLDERKNPLFMVEVMHHLKKRLNQDIHLLIVGDGKLRTEMERFARQFGVEMNVHFSGAQESAAPWYSAMDVLLLPSLCEGLSLVGVEAQTAGLPCIFSDCVTRELAITDLSCFLSIGENAAEIWSDKIMEVKSCIVDRKQYAEIMRCTPYDLKNGAIQLEKIYTVVSN